MKPPCLGELLPQEVDRLVWRINHAQSGLGAHAGTDASKLLALNGLMKFERVTPISFTAESVEAKSLPALVDHLL